MRHGACFFVSFFKAKSLHCAALHLKCPEFTCLFSFSFFLGGGKGVAGEILP